MGLRLHLTNHLGLWDQPVQAPKPLWDRAFSTGQACRPCRKEGRISHNDQNKDGRDSSLAPTVIVDRPLRRDRQRTAWPLHGLFIIGCLGDVKDQRRRLPIAGNRRGKAIIGQIGPPTISNGLSLLIRRCRHGWIRQRHRNAAHKLGTLHISARYVRPDIRFRIIRP